jgi:hypothetical protein
MEHLGIKFMTDSDQLNRCVDQRNCDLRTTFFHPEHEKNGKSGKITVKTFFQ